MTRRPTLHEIEMPLGKVVYVAEAEVERLNPVKTRTLVNTVCVLYDGEPIEEWNARTKAGLSLTTLEGFRRVVKVLLKAKVEDEAVRLDEGR